MEFLPASIPCIWTDGRRLQFCLGSIIHLGHYKVTPNSHQSRSIFCNGKEATVSTLAVLHQKVINVIAIQAYLLESIIISELEQPSEKIQGSCIHVHIVVVVVVIIVVVIIVIIVVVVVDVVDHSHSDGHKGLDEDKEREDGEGAVSAILSTTMAAMSSTPRMP